MSGVVPTTVNAEQKAAIEHGPGPLLIVAGAGTGKTTVITQRIAWLILEQGIPTDGLLALTFTDKAAMEMEERVDRLLPYGYVNLWISTFHAFCERILRQHAIDIGLSGDFRLLNQTEQWLLLRRNIDRFDLQYYRPLGNPSRFISALIKHFSRLEDEDITPQAYRAYAESLRLDRDDPNFTKQKNQDDQISEAERIREVAAAYALYRQILLDERSLDFGLLITYTIELFKKRPTIIERYRHQFQYVLVDEFQDTNWAQYELMKFLAAPRHNLTVVGDDDQSIYKFRGASVSNIIQFHRDFPQARQIVLTKNYRSPQNILDVAYNFIQRNNPNRLEVALQDGAKNALPAMTKRLRAHDPAAGTIEFLSTRTQEAEARMVREKIYELHEKYNTPWPEFAVLVRANDQAEQFTRQLELAGIPYQFVASRGLYRRSDVLDLVAYLRLLDNYHESTAIYRLFNLPLFTIKPEELIELNDYAKRRALSLYEALIQQRTITGLSTTARQTIERLLHFIRTGTTFAQSHKITEVLYEFLKNTRILTELSRKGQAEFALDRIGAIRSFMSEVGEYEKLHGPATVRDFLQYFDLKLEAGDAGSIDPWSENDLDAVRVMTVHGAKGLEFSYVFIVQLVDRRFPTIERKDPIAIPDALVREIVPAGDLHLEEERRLLYVAITRAKKGVYFTAAEDYGGVRAKKPSRFLFELGLLDTESQKEIKPLAELETPPKPMIDVSGLRYRGSKYSFSALRSYEKCPWQFRYAYILKIPVGGKATTSFGSSMHNTLQRFFSLVAERRQNAQASLFTGHERRENQKPLVTLDELMDIYDQEFIVDWYASAVEREKFRDRGRASLKVFYERQAAKMPVTLGVERDFHWKLDQYTISGKIDRIDLLGVNAHTKQRQIGIVDYKSGHSRDESLGREDRYQLLIYALATQDPQVMNAEVKRLSYYYLEDNREVLVEPNEKDMSGTHQWLRDVISRVEGGNFEATPGLVCKHCDFRDICEYRDPNY